MIFKGFLEAWHGLSGYYHFVYILMRVCKRWNNAIMHSPEFWAFVEGESLMYPPLW